MPATLSPSLRLTTTDFLRDTDVNPDEAVAVGAALQANSLEQGDERILLLDHIGAKSGRRRTSPLMFHEGDGIVAVAASKAGQPTHLDPVRPIGPTRLQAMQEEDLVAHFAHRDVKVTNCY